MKRCPHCYTHPKLVQSGWAKLSLKCPVCNERFASPYEEERKEDRQDKIASDVAKAYWNYWQKQFGGKNVKKP